jgi:hypothetical protein
MLLQIYISDRQIKNAILQLSSIPVCLRFFAQLVSNYAMLIPLLML